MGPWHQKAPKTSINNISFSKKLWPTFLAHQGFKPMGHHEQEIPGTKIVWLECWENPINERLRAAIDIKNQCGGVPYLFNRNLGKRKGHLSRRSSKSTGTSTSMCVGHKIIKYPSKFDFETTAR